MLSSDLEKSTATCPEPGERRSPRRPSGGSPAPSLRPWAEAYAPHRVRMPPLRPGGKEPLGKLAPNGVKDATADLVTVREWWSSEPSANIRLATGRSGGGSWCVVDIDGDEGFATLAKREAEFGP